MATLSHRDYSNSDLVSIIQYSKSIYTKGTSLCQESTNSSQNHQDTSARRKMLQRAIHRKSGTPARGLRSLNTSITSDCSRTTSNKSIPRPLNSKRVAQRAPIDRSPSAPRPIPKFGRTNSATRERPPAVSTKPSMVDNIITQAKQVSVMLKTENDCHYLKRLIKEAVDQLRMSGHLTESLVIRIKGIDELETLVEPLQSKLRNVMSLCVKEVPRVEVSGQFREALLELYHMLWGVPKERKSIDQEIPYEEPEIRRPVSFSGPYQIIKLIEVPMTSQSAKVTPAGSPDRIVKNFTPVSAMMQEKVDFGQEYRTGKRENRLSDTTVSSSDVPIAEKSVDWDERIKSFINKYLPETEDTNKKEVEQTSELMDTHNRIMQEKEKLQRLLNRYRV